MSIITAYKCDETGKLFEDRTKYVRHLKKIAKKRLIVKKTERNHRSDQQWWHDNFWNRVRSLAQLQAAILHHREVFASNGVKNSWNSKTLRPTPITNFRIFSLKWASQISNSHHCPHDGVENFSRDKSSPLIYSGWQGHIDYTVQSYSDQLYCYPGSSNMWENTRIHTGTGGGGGHKDQKTNNCQSFGYHVRLFASDWPKMAEAYDKVRIILALQSVNQNHSDIDSLVNEFYPAEDYFLDE